MARAMLGVTVGRRVLGSLNDLALLSRFAIEGRSHIDLTSLAIKIADTACSPIKYECPGSMTLALLRDRCNDVSGNARGRIRILLLKSTLCRGPISPLSRAFAPEM
jgi:hypothetical protein